MMKHIKKHTNTFLFFLGGLFLMLVGPALIPFSSAATVADTPAKYDDSKHVKYVIDNESKILYMSNNTIKNDVKLEVRLDDLPKGAKKMALFYYNNAKEEIVEQPFDHKENMDRFEVSIPKDIANGNTIATVGLYNAINALITTLRIQLVSEQELAKISEPVNNSSHSSPQFSSLTKENLEKKIGVRDNNNRNVDYLNFTTAQLLSTKQALANAEVKAKFEGSSITAAVTRLVDAFSALFNGLTNNIRVMILYNITRDYQISLLEIENNAFKKQIELLKNAFYFIAPQAAKSLELKENMKKLKEQAIRDSKQIGVEAAKQYLSTLEVLNLKNQAKEFEGLINKKTKDDSTYNKDTYIKSTNSSVNQKNVSKNVHDASLKATATQETHESAARNADQTNLNEVFSTKKKDNINQQKAAGLNGNKNRQK